MEPNTNNAPAASDAGNDGQVVSTPSESVQTVEGQGEGVASVTTPESTKAPVTFEERQSAFFKKKGWDITKGPEQLLTSYEELEGKIGNYSDVASKAKQYDDLYQKALDWQKKALMWDDAQKYLEQQTIDQQIKNGNMDIEKLPVPQLVNLWKQGKVGLNDLSPALQWQVQREAMAEEQRQADTERNIEEQSKQEAQQLTERHPVLKDPYHRDLIASAIERGVSINGRELNPEEIIIQYEQKLQEAERKGEERLKADMEKLKQGNMERTSSAAPTQANGKAKSVFEAYNYAKQKHNL